MIESRSGTHISAALALLALYGSVAASLSASGETNSQPDEALQAQELLNSLDLNDSSSQGMDANRHKLEEAARLLEEVTKKGMYQDAAFKPTCAT